MNKELTLEEAENIVDNMYQKRWIECGVENGNTIHMENLDKLQYSELEKASILLLRTEIRLQSQLKKQKEVIDKAIEFTNKNWGTWCTHHLEYMTELQNILKRCQNERLY